MKTIEEKKKILNSLVSMCESAKGEHPKDLSIQDISKIECTRYPTQPMEQIKIYFRTKGSQSNNKPFNYPEELPIGTYNQLSEYLYDVRTKNNSQCIGSIFSVVKEQKEEKLTTEQKKALKQLGYENE